MGNIIKSNIMSFEFEKIPLLWPLVQVLVSGLVPDHFQK